MVDTMDDELTSLTKVGDVWYRYNDIHYAAPLDEWEQPVGPGRSDVSCQEYRIVKVTPKGVWVEYAVFAGDRRFVLVGARKQYAWPTKILALRSYIARKKRHRHVLVHQLARVETMMGIADRLLRAIDPTHGKDPECTPILPPIRLPGLIP